jgi:DNA (cytosine-5)-methyltransferase 1
LLFLENVKGLLSHDKGKTFETIITTLDELGYDLQWQVLNSKNFGVPQNRERMFIIGHLRGTPRPQVFPFGEDDKLSNGEGKSKERPTQTKFSTTVREGMGNKADSTFVKVPEATKKGYAEAEVGDSINLSVPNSKTRRGRVGKGIAQTIDTGMQQHTLKGSRIRRLTPTECERLQGFPDGWTEGVSDTQRYKTLGNAVTVNVIQAIMTRLLNEKNTT